jgi:hypothetical protein
MTRKRLEQCRTIEKALNFAQQLASQAGPEAARAALQLAMSSGLPRKGARPRRWRFEAVRD